MEVNKVARMVADKKREKKVLDMVADMEVDRVVDIEVDMVADMEVGMFGDIDIIIDINWAQTFSTRSLPGLRIF